MIKIGVYITERNVVEGASFGIAKHTIGMINALRKEKNVEIILFGSYVIKKNPCFLFKNFQFYSLPFKTKLLELSWKILHWPIIDRYIPNIDALYVPGEQIVPSKKYKIFYTIHDTYHFEDYKWRVRMELLKLSYKIYLRRVYKILTVSNFSMDSIQQIFSEPKSKFLVLGNGLGFKKNIYDLKKNNKSGSYITIGGPINEKKGGWQILKLCSYVESRDNELDIYIIGGIDVGFLNTYKECNLKRTKVFNRGQLSDEEVIELLYNSLCYIQLSNVEGFGMTVIEAMHLGTPTIINQIPSLIEISNGSSMVCDNKNITGIMNRISKIKNDHSLRSDLIKSGIRQAKKYQWEKYSKALKSEIIKSLHN